jgi:O-antigen/teichoic acid export membrane protein
VARAHGAGDSGAIRDSLQLGTRFQVALLAPFALLLGWHAPVILQAWLGPSAVPAAQPLRMLCVALALAAVAMHPAICLGMTGRHRLVAQAALGGALLRLLAGVLLIGPFGLVGVGIAAIATALVVDVGIVATSACRHARLPFTTFLRQAIAPAVPGLLATAAAAAVLEHWHAPSTLAAVAAQSCVAGATFVLLFLPFGLRGLVPAQPTPATAHLPEPVRS